MPYADARSGGGPTAAAGLDLWMTGRTRRIVDNRRHGAGTRSATSAGPQLPVPRAPAARAPPADPTSSADESPPATGGWASAIG